LKQVAHEQKIKGAIVLSQFLAGKIAEIIENKEHIVRFFLIKAINLKRSPRKSKP
jgi:hypothetical protein